MNDISFEFIQHPDLKASLVSDYREMIVGQENRCWKSVHILAGSIIEALLVDDLAFIHHSEEAHILKTTFEKLIERCGSEELLTKRAVDLSTVVRGYRNLVHPGRMVRLKDAVDEDGANTAIALVRMVVKEVAARRIGTYGPTADQVVEKLRIDPHNKTAYTRLIEELRDNEALQLSLKAIPACLRGLDLDEDYAVANALRGAMSTAFSRLNKTERPKLSREYADLIKRGSDVDISQFERFLFDGKWLGYAAQTDRDLIIDHLLDKFRRKPENQLRIMNNLVDLANKLSFFEVMRYATLGISRGDLDKDERSECRQFVVETCSWVSEPRLKMVEETVKHLASTFRSSHPQLAQFLDTVKVECDLFWDE